MAEDLERLASLVYQRARTVETTFARFRAKDFPTHHFEALAKFPQATANEIRRAVPRRLRQASEPSVSTASVARILRRYGQALEFVHQSLDFVVNAEVLSIPAPFVLFLEELGSPFLRPRFVLQGAPLFNYSFNSIAPTLNRPVVQAGLRARLPDRFAVFRFPVALREDGLQHSILVHELGHYLDSAESLYREAWLEARPAVKDRIVRFISRQMGTVPQGLDQGRVEALISVYATWLSETVSDLFAARVLGPAYLFSSIEFVSFRPDLTNGSETHPPSATRLWIILEELKALGWQSGLEDCLQLEITEPRRWTAAAIRALPGAERPWRVFERCLRELLPAIRRVVRRRVGTNSYRRAEYLEYSEKMAGLLGHRVPPGQLWTDGGPSGAIPPKAIVNAGWFFHLGGYKGWPALRGDALGRAYEKRQLLSRLVLKALEISYVVRRWGRGTRRQGQAK